jgi:hypothetical protein
MERRVRTENKKKRVKTHLWGPGREYGPERCEVSRGLQGKGCK